MSKVHSVLRTEDQICCYRSITSSGVRVLWEITSACNLKCDFCLVEMKRKQVSLDQALEIADALIAQGVDKVLLSGGEPLLFRGVEHVMRRLVDGGVLVKLLTNGTVANEAVFQMIESDPTIEVSMSILSVRPEQGRRHLPPRRCLGEAVRHPRSAAPAAGQHHHPGQLGELRRGRGDHRLGRGPGDPRNQRHQCLQGPEFAGAVS